MKWCDHTTLVQEMADTLKRKITGTGTVLLCVAVAVSCWGTRAELVQEETLPRAISDPALPLPRQM